MEALHREKALLGHCASAAARSGSIRELFLQNKFTLIKMENNNSFVKYQTYSEVINKQLWSLVFLESGFLDIKHTFQKKKSPSLQFIEHILRWLMAALLFFITFN